MKPLRLVNSATVRQNTLLPAYYYELSAAVYGWVQNIAADQRSAEPQEDIPLTVEGQEIALNIYFRNNFPPNDAGFLFTIETGGTAVGTDIRRYSNSIITIVNLERLLLSV